MPRRVGPVEGVVAVARIAAATTGRTALVGIDGLGAAGKSSLAAAVASAVPGVAVVAVDDFGGPGIREWDWARFRDQVLLPVLAGRPTRYQAWEWNADAGGRWIELGSPRLLVVEGVSATRAEVGAPWDLTLWVDAPADLRLRRAIERDGAGLRPRWRDDWIPSEQAYVAREHPERRVDLIVDGTGG